VTDTDRLNADLTEVVSSIQGESNWLSDSERCERIGKGVGMLVGSLGVLAAIWWWRRRSTATA
jgi:hypothetical protein